MTQSSVEHNIGYLSRSCSKQYQQQLLSLPLFSLFFFFSSFPLFFLLRILLGLEAYSVNFIYLVVKNNKAIKNDIGDRQEDVSCVIRQREEEKRFVFLLVIVLFITLSTFLVHVFFMQQNLQYLYNVIMFEIPREAHSSTVTQSSAALTNHTQTAFDKQSPIWPSMRILPCPRRNRRRHWPPIL